MMDGPCGVREEGVSQERCKQMLMLIDRAQRRMGGRRGLMGKCLRGRRGESQRAAGLGLQGRNACVCLGELKGNRGCLYSQE